LYTNTPGFGYESGGYAPFLTESFSIHARARSWRSSEAVINDEECNLVTKERAGTSETLLDWSGTNIVRKGERNEVEASWIRPTSFIHLFPLESIFSWRLKTICPIKYLWKKSSKDRRRVSPGQDEDKGNSILVQHCP
jgi:hypothetical protein